MKIRKTSIILIILSVLCLSRIYSAVLGSSQPIDILINPRGTTKIGFLSSQPLDITNIPEEAFSGVLSDMSDSSDPLHAGEISASGKYFFYVDTTYNPFHVTMDITPLANGNTSSAFTGLPFSIKIGEVGFNIGGNAECAAPQAGSEAVFLPVTSPSGSREVMDETNTSRWESFTIKAYVDTQILKEKNLNFKGTVRVSFVNEK